MEKKYRSSIYNIYLKENEEYYIFQGSTGALSSFESDSINFLKDGTHTKDEYIKFFNEDIFNRMLNRGFITEYDINEEKEYHRKLSKAIDEKNPKSISIVIAVTYYCNFRCPYCFENVSKKDLDKYKKSLITKEIVDDIFTFIEDKKEDGIEVNSIMLFGGEPLLKENFEIVKYIAKRGHSEGIKIGAVTNGYDLDSYFELCKNDLISHLQITIDGIGKIHNRRRVHARGFDTFTKIEKNIDYLLKNSSVEIESIGNYDNKNIDNIKELIEFYKSKKWIDNRRFSYYFRSLHACYKSKSEEKMDDYILGKSLDRDTKFMHVVKYDEVNNVLKKMFLEKKIPYLSPEFCSACGRMYVFDSYRNVYPCWETVGIENMKIGKLTEEGKVLLNSLYKKWKHRKTYNIEKCNECSYSLICRGECPMHTYVSTGEMYDPQCGNNKKIIDESLIYNIEKSIYGK